jgi:hypothetical protein
VAALFSQAEGIDDDFHVRIEFADLSLLILPSVLRSRVVKIWRCRFDNSTRSDQPGRESTPAPQIEGSR